MGSDGCHPLLEITCNTDATRVHPLFGRMSGRCGRPKTAPAMTVLHYPSDLTNAEWALRRPSESFSIDELRRDCRHRHGIGFARLEQIPLAVERHRHRGVSHQHLDALGAKTLFNPKGGEAWRRRAGSIWRRAGRPQRHGDAGGDLNRPEYPRQEIAVVLDLAGPFGQTSSVRPWGRPGATVSNGSPAMGSSGSYECRLPTSGVRIC